MKVAPTIYPAALTVFIAPDKAYDQPKSSRMAGNSKA
jgi:hypothetical protein